MQKVESLPPADCQLNIFHKGAKSNALSKTFQLTPIFSNFPLALLGCNDVFACHLKMKTTHKLNSHKTFRKTTHLFLA
jgi:hypothetical protein